MRKKGCVQVSCDRQSEEKDSGQDMGGRVWRGDKKEGGDIGSTPWATA